MILNHLYPQPHRIIVKKGILYSYKNNFFFFKNYNKN